MDDLKHLEPQFIDQFSDQHAGAQFRKSRLGKGQSPQKAVPGTILDPLCNQRHIQTNKQQLLISSAPNQWEWKNKTG
jgi:hypothetical protein